MNEKILRLGLSEAPTTTHMLWLEDRGDVIMMNCRNVKTGLKQVILHIWKTGDGIEVTRIPFASRAVGLPSDEHGAIKDGGIK